MQTILVVEDERDIEELLVAILEYAGYRIVTAGNGQEALECLETARPALILSDVMMPVMDGRELCKRLQSHADHRSIPILLMSAAYRAASLDGCKPAAFLKKPFETIELIEVVKKVLGAGEGPTES
jgi:two-component system alkaline phosphatase synthesis response regulator PhoP